MASRIAEAYIQIVPRIDGIASSLNNQLSGEMATAGEAGATGFATGFKKILGPALLTAGVVATAALGNFLKDSVALASTFEAEFEGVNQVFGDFSAGVQEFAQNAGKTAGLGANEALQASKTFGLFFTGAGKSAEEAAKFSTTLVQLAGDLGSFNDVPTEQALAAIQSGLMGQAEPLRNFGVFLDDARLKQEALNMGIYDGTGPLDTQQKMMASYSAILAQTNIQQGDFVKYADTYGNQQKILDSELQRLSTTVGLALLPAMTSITTYMNDHVVPAFFGAFDTIKSIFQVMSDNIPTISTFIGVLGGLLIIFNAVRIATTLWSIAQGILNVIMGLNPFTLIAIAIAALVAAIVWVATETTFFQDAWAAMTEFIGNAWDGLYNGFIKPIADAIGAVFTFLYENIIRPVYLGIMLYIGLWAAAFEALYNFIILPIVTWIGEIFMGLWNNFIKPVVDFIIGAFVWLGEAFSALWSDIIEPGISAIGDGFVALWENFIKPIIDWIVGAFDFMGQVVTDIFTGIGSAISDVFQGLIGIIRGPVNAVIGLINALIDGLNMIKIDIPDWVPEWGGKSIGFNLSRIPALAKGGFVDEPTTALIGEAGPEVVMPLNRFEQLMGIGSGSGQTINYYAAPNQSLDAEQALLQAVKRARVITGW
jgi:hypothetical protein